MSKNKHTKAPEVMWIAVAVLSLVAAIHKTVNLGFKESWYFYGFVLIALLMWFVRNTVRKKREKDAGLD